MRLRQRLQQHERRERGLHDLRCRHVHGGEQRGAHDLDLLGLRQHQQILLRVGRGHELLDLLGH